MQSVLGQEGVLLEYIVIDGGSTDGSQEIIKDYSRRLAYWVTEPDGGIAHAMNKGIRQARGDWLLFLQSDDYLPGKTILERALALLKPTDRLACFSIDRVSQKGAVRPVKPRGFIWWLNFKMTFSHQGTLFHRGLFSEFGLYNESYKVAMDYDYFIRLFRAGTKAAPHAELTLAVMRETGLSSRREWPHLRARLAEEKAIHSQHAKSELFTLIYAVYWPLYWLYRRLRFWITCVTPAR